MTESVAFTFQQIEEFISVFVMKGDSITMNLRTKFSVLLCSVLLSLSCMAFATPASDVLAKEDAVAMQIVVSILRGDQDFSYLKKSVDTKVFDVSKLKDAKKTIPGMAKADKVSFVGFERNGNYDRISYLAIEGTQPKSIIGILFNPQTNLAIGVMAGDVNQQQAAPAKK